MHKRNTLSSRRIITVTEWTVFLKLSRNTVKSRISEYEKTGKTYNDRDILSILDFFFFVKSL